MKITDYFNIIVRYLMALATVSSFAVYSYFVLPWLTTYDWTAAGIFAFMLVALFWLYSLACAFYAGFFAIYPRAEATMQGKYAPNRVALLALILSVGIIIQLSFVGAAYADYGKTEPDYEQTMAALGLLLGWGFRLLAAGIICEVAWGIITIFLPNELENTREAYLNG